MNALLILHPFDLVVPRPVYDSNDLDLPPDGLEYQEKVAAAKNEAGPRNAAERR